MNTYRTYSSSPFSLFVTFLIIATFSAILVFSLENYFSPIILGILYLSSILFPSLYLPRLLALSKLEIQIHDDKIEVKWLKQLAFERERDREIPLNEIKSYTSSFGKRSRDYVLTLKQGSKFYIHQYNWFSTKNDDFDLIKTEISRTVDQYKLRGSNMQNPQSDKSPSTIIPENEREMRKSIRGRFFTIIFGSIAIYIFTGLSVLRIAFPQNPLYFNYKLLCVGIFLITVMAQAYSTIQKKRKKKERMKMRNL